MSKLVGVKIWQAKPISGQLELFPELFGIDVEQRLVCFPLLHHIVYGLSQPWHCLWVVQRKGIAEDTGLVWHFVLFVADYQCVVLVLLPSSPDRRHQILCEKCQGLPRPQVRIEAQ